MRSSIVILLAAGLVALGGCDRQSGENAQAKADASNPSGDDSPGHLDISQRGAAMPDVMFMDPDGKAVTLAQFKGKPLLVNLWATWCGPCVKEMPTLDALAKREAGRLQVLTISQDGKGKVIVDTWFAKKNFTMLQAYTDPENVLGLAYATGMLPTTVLYDAQGKEVWRVLGEMQWDGPRANTLLAETLGN